MQDGVLTSTSWGHAFLASLMPISLHEQTCAKTGSLVGVMGWHSSAEPVRPAPAWPTVLVGIMLHRKDGATAAAALLQPAAGLLAPAPAAACLR